MELDKAMEDPSRSPLFLQIQEQFWLGVRFPSLPFTMARGKVRAFEFDRVVGPDFASLVELLAQRFEDQTVAFWGVEQSPSYFLKVHGELPGFQISPGISQGDFMGVLDRNRGGDPQGNLLYAANVFAACGDSQRWAVWAQRDWEIAVLATTEDPEDHLDALGWVNTPFSERIDEFRGPSGWVTPLYPATVREMALAVEQFARD